MSKHLLVICNSRSSTLQTELLDTSSWTNTSLGHEPIWGANGTGDAAPLVMYGDRLWLAWRGSPQALVTYDVDASNQKITRLHSFQLNESISYISVTKDRRFLLGAGGRSGYVWRLDKSGLPQEEVCRVELGDMAHCFVAHGTRVLGTACLGNRLRSFDIHPETGYLTFRDELEFPDQMGPRHLVFSDKGDLAYLLMQEGGVVVTVSTDPRLSVRQTLSFVEPDRSALSADIGISTDETHLFVTERNANSLHILPIDDEGLLCIGEQTRVPDYPRSLVVDPMGFVVTLGFRGHEASVHELTSEGELIHRLTFPTGERPSWITSVEVG